MWTRSPSLWATSMMATFFMLTTFKFSHTMRPAIPAPMMAISFGLAAGTSTMLPCSSCSEATPSNQGPSASRPLELPIATLNARFTRLSWDLKTWGFTLADELVPLAPCLMAFQLLGSKSTATAIFKFAGDSYWGEIFARPPCEVIPIVPRGKYNGGATRLSFLPSVTPPPRGRGIRIDIYKLSFISHSTINFCQHYNHRPGLLCRCDENGA